MYMKCLSIFSLVFVLAACESNQNISKTIDTGIISNTMDAVFEEALITSLSNAHFSESTLRQFQSLKINDIKTFPDLFDRYYRLQLWLTEQNLIKPDSSVKITNPETLLVAKIHSKQPLTGDEEKLLASNDDWTIDAALSFYHFKNSAFGDVLNDLVRIKSKHSLTNPSFEIVKRNIELAFELGLTHLQSALDLGDSSITFAKFYELVKNEANFDFLPQDHENLDRIIERLDLAVSLVNVLNSRRPELEIEKRMQKILAQKKSLIADLELDLEGYAQAVIAIERAIMDLPDGKNFFPYQAVEPQKALVAFKKLLKQLGQ